MKLGETEQKITSIRNERYSSDDFIENENKQSHLGGTAG